MSSSFNLTKIMTTSPQTDLCLRFAERVGLLAAAGGSNFVFSPLSIRAALSLAAVGSKGETLDQFLSFLGSPTISHLNSATTQLLESVRVTRSEDGSGDGGGSRLSFVNGVWVDKSMALKPSFQQIATSIYGAVANSVDFQNQAPAATIEVNDWVQEATNGLIKDLIPSHSLDHLTRIILANALYFKGRWSEKFDRSQTKNGEFHLLNGSTIQVPFMTSTKDQFLSSFDGFKVLRLSYQPDQEHRSFSMLLFLPDMRDGLSSLIEKVVSDPSFLNRHFPKRKVEVRKFMIPKFKVSSGFEASDVLRGVGLELPFSKGADFMEMVMASSPGCRLFVSSVHHKATIEVEEEGTVAAAATGMELRKCCYTPPKDFVADHPFMFAIREDKTGAVLFLGHVANPLVVETSI